jgi:NADH dehydrogenase (ubiquinone) 1 alpha subcomplex subunit 2
MKHHNPHTPIMIREALNTQPRVFARYEFGREKVEELSGECDKKREHRNRSRTELGREGKHTSRN